MVSAELLGRIAALQAAYFDLLATLLDGDTRQVKPDISFAKVCATSQDARKAFDSLVELAYSSAMQQQVVDEFRVAIIGSSNHGKTSVLAEMFPDLTDRGLLITDVKDTTSQALVIRSGAGSEMVFTPWGLDEIRYLVDISREELLRRKIDVQYREDHIEIDGEDADFDAGVKAAFKFGVRQKLKPFAGTYRVNAEQEADGDLVARLTTKVDYSRSARPKDLVVNGEAFNDLQFRAAVRSVDMGSTFSEISRWLEKHGAPAGLSGRMTFIDTPGLKAGGGASDEVLRQVLARKNQQIVVEMLKSDELDLIVHLVLCGQQSDFASLWNELEKIDGSVLQDLGQRIIVAVNGFNQYFDNPDLARRWREGESGGEDDHFNVSLRSNILGKLSERGTLDPLSICFLDVRRFVEARGVSYGDYYRERRATAETWADPSGVGHATLRQLGILETYRDNLDALCDPADCGKGFLVGRILHAWQTQGPRLMVRRFVLRSGLLRSIRDLRDLLGTYYDASGKMTRQSYTDALKAALAFLDPRHPDAVDKFCRREIDPFIVKEAVDRALEGDSGKSWPVHAFKKTVSWLFARIKAHNPTLRPEVEAILNEVLTREFRAASTAWGYAAAHLPAPTRDDQAPRHLIVHALKYHAREFVHRCMQMAGTDDDLAGVMQDDDDRTRIAELLASISRLQGEAEQLCTIHGVTIT